MCVFRETRRADRAGRLEIYRGCRERRERIQKASPSCSKREILLRRRLSAASKPQTTRVKFARTKCLKMTFPMNIEIRTSRDAGAGFTPALPNAGSAFVRRLHRPAGSKIT